MSEPLHEERVYTGTRANREKPPGESNVTAQGSAQAEPIGWNPQQIQPGGILDSTYHQPRITSTMVQDPISALKEQIFVSPLTGPADQIVAQMEVPEARPPQFDKQGNLIDPWSNMPSGAPTMHVVKRADARPVATSRVAVSEAETAPRVESPSVASRMAEAAKRPTYEMPWLGVDKAVEPNKSVAFKTNIGLHSAFYHEVVLTDRIVTLVYDTRFKGTMFLPLAPERGEMIDLSISYMGKEYPVHHLGGIFETGCLTYLVLLRPPQETQEEIHAIDPFAGQEALMNLEE
jgi:hypothetical protein